MYATLGIGQVRAPVLQDCYVLEFRPTTDKTRFFVARAWPLGRAATLTS